MADFKVAYEYMIDNEGKQYSNRPKDKGGPTKFGITQATLADWNQRHGLPYPSAADVENLTEDVAIQIYQADYWDKMGLPYINDNSLATALFDMGVNDGPGTSIRWAQRAVGFAEHSIDGIVGHATTAALNHWGRGLLPAFIKEAQDHYIQIVVSSPPQIANLAGWLNRTQRLIALLI